MYVFHPSGQTMPNLLQTSFQTHYTLIIIFQGIVLVYDVTTEDSFKHIAQWLQNIQDVSAAVICLCSLQNTLYIRPGNSQENAKNLQFLRLRIPSRRGQDVIYQAWDAVFYHEMNTKNRVENTSHSGVFLTNFKVFHLVMEHHVKCLTLLLKPNDFRRRN